MLAVQGESFGLLTDTDVIKQFTLAPEMLAMNTPVVEFSAAVVGSAVADVANCNSALPVRCVLNCSAPDGALLPSVMFLVSEFLLTEKLLEMYATELIVIVGAPEGKVPSEYGIGLRVRYP